MWIEGKEERIEGEQWVKLMVGGERRNAKKTVEKWQFVVKVWAQTPHSALIVSDGCIRDLVM